MLSPFFNHLFLFNLNLFIYIYIYDCSKVFNLNNSVVKLTLKCKNPDRKVNCFDFNNKKKISKKEGKH